jgi:hypothetical protein
MRVFVIAVIAVIVLIGVRLALWEADRGDRDE